MRISQSYTIFFQYNSLKRKDNIFILELHLTSFGDLLKENGPQDSLKIVYITYIYIYMIENTTPPGIGPPPVGGVDRKGKRLGLFDALRQPLARRQGRAIAFLQSLFDGFSKVFLTSGDSLLIATARKAAKGDCPFNFKGLGNLTCNA